MGRKRRIKEPESPRSNLPALFFSEDAGLCDERGVRARLPEISDSGELRLRFLRGLGGASEGFAGFCASSPAEEETGYRCYALEGFGPFRAAFAEKTVLLDTPVTAVFLASSATSFYLLMSPSSRSATRTVDRILFELAYLMHGGSPPFSSLSPEVFAAVERVPRLAEALFARRSSSRCCPLDGLIREVSSAVGQTPPFRGVKLTAESVPVPRGSTEMIADFPVEALVAALTCLLFLLRSQSADAEIGMKLSGEGRIREIALTASVPGSLFRDADGGEGFDLLYSFPPEFHDRIRMASVLCLLAHFGTSARLSDAPAEDAPIRLLTVSLLIGAGPPPILDFKYSDPIAAAKGIVCEIAALFGGEDADLSATPGP